MYLKYAITTAVSVFALSSAAMAQDIRFGIEGGIASADLAAGDTAQTLANLTGRTVTYTEDSATTAARVFVEIGLSEGISAEIGYFATGSLDATYSFSGTTVTASEGAKASGLDFGVKFNPSNDVFFRVGVHMSDLTQTASATISGTTYTATLSQDGTGGYVGGGFFINENTSIGLTYYSDLGGAANADATFLFVGYHF